MSEQTPPAVAGRLHAGVRPGLTTTRSETALGLNAMDKQETTKLGPLAPRWYCVSANGMATLCKDQEDAQANARHCDLAWPNGAPHRAVLLGDVAADTELLRAENAALKRDLQYARDGLTKGRTRMREDIERLTRELKEARAALAGLVQVYVIDGAATTPASEIGDAWKAAQRALLRA